MYGHSPDAEKQEVRQNLHSLLCSQAISKNGFDAVEASLSHEWGPFQGSVTDIHAPPDQTFHELESHLKSLTQSNYLSREALGIIYTIVSEERAGYPAPPLNPAMGYPAPGQQNGTKSRGLFGHKSNSYSQGGPGGGSGGQSKVHSQASQLGQKVLDSAAHGFGFTLGADAANSLWHGLFG